MEDPQSRTKTKISLTFKCKGLPVLEPNQSKNPQVFVEIKNGPQEKFQLVGKTEISMASLSHEFVKAVEIPFYFECNQILKCSVFYVEEIREVFVGSVTCTVGELYRSSNSLLKKTLSNEVGAALYAKIEIRAEEIFDCDNNNLVINCSASKLDKKDIFGKSDGYLCFYKKNKDESWTLVHKTEVIMNNLNPVWQEQIIPVRTLCNGDLARKIKVTCYDWDLGGSDDLIGSFETCVSDLLSGPHTFELINQKKLKKSQYKNSGTLNLTAKLVKGYSYLDYIRGGMEVSLSVAVDFSSLDGKSGGPHGLHSSSSNRRMDPYQTALLSISRVLSDWDSDSLYQAYGFGAKLPDGSISHCFAMTGDPNNSTVHGVDGLMQAYINTVGHVTPCGPAKLAQVIRTVATHACQFPPGSKYTVLLILTEGNIADMEETTDEVVKASGYPLSIVIVGLGSAHNDKLRALDADVAPLVSRRYGSMKRDIVQFVDFTEITKRGVDISSATLEELPEQIMSYCRQQHVTPGNKNSSQAQ